MGKESESRRILASGVYWNGTHLVAAVVVRAGLGRRSTETFEVPVEAEEGLPKTIAGLIESGRVGGRLAFGLEPRHLFCLTRRLEGRANPRDRVALASEMLPARLNSLRGGIAADLITVRLPRGLHALLVAAPRPRASELLEGLSACHPAGVRLLSVPLAMARLAEAKHSRPRRWRTLLRVLPGERQGLVVVYHGDLPLAWRMFDTGEGLGESMETAAVSLRAHAKEDLGLENIDGVLLHAGDDATEAASRLSNDLSLPVVAAPAVPVDDETFSVALAAAALRGGRDGIDLFRSLRPPANLRQNFPYRVAAALGGVVVAAGALLLHEALSIEREAAATVTRATESLQEIGLDVDALIDDFERLETEVAVAEAFLVRRVFWEPILRELPDLIPADMALTDFDGRDNVVFPTDGASGLALARRQLTLAGEVALDGGTASPPEAAELTAALRDSQHLAAKFGQIHGATINLQNGPKGPSASVSVLCLPTRP